MLEHNLNVYENISVCNNWTGGVGNTLRAVILTHVFLLRSLSERESSYRVCLTVNLNFLSARYNFALHNRHHSHHIAVIVDIRALCLEFINQPE